MQQLFRFFEKLLPIPGLCPINSAVSERPQVSVLSEIMIPALPQIYSIESSSLCGESAGRRCKPSPGCLSQYLQHIPPSPVGTAPPKKITELPKPGMGWVGKDLEDHLFPAMGRDSREEELWEGAMEKLG